MYSEIGLNRLEIFYSGNYSFPCFKGYCNDCLGVNDILDLNGIALVIDNGPCV